MKKDDVVIFSYTRAQAIADGVLIDATELAKAGGFSVARSRSRPAYGPSAWRCPRAWPDRTRPADSGSVLNLLHFAIARQKGDGQRVDFAVHVRNDNRAGDPSLVHLYALCGPGDDAEPVITVMLPSED